jgi:hypothetical protein
MISRELTGFADRFREKQVNYIVTKGPVLSFILFGDVSRRNYNDLDVHVHPNDYQPVLDELLNAGYRVLYPELNKDFDYRYYFRYKKDIGLLNPETGVYIELHFGLNFKGIVPDALEKAFFTERGEIEIAGRSIPAPRDEHHFLYLCLHGAKHMYARLFWLKDIGDCITYLEIDHESVMANAKKFGLVRILGLSLILAEKYLGTRIPGEYVTAIRSRRAEKLSQLCEKRIFGPEKQSLWTKILKHWYFLQLRSEFRYKIAQFRDLFHRRNIRLRMGGH